MKIQVQLYSLSVCYMKSEVINGIWWICIFKGNDNLEVIDSDAGDLLYLRNDTIDKIYVFKC